MPANIATSVENNFTKGLITEATGLNFPENAATDADNVEFTLVGDVIRREGINYEDNFVIQAIDRTGQAVNTYKWNNAGGDGLTQVIVAQIGATLRFWTASSATTLSPLSQQLLAGNIALQPFTVTGSVFDPTAECQFSDGNGYLFVYHPSCEPFYVTLSNGTITGNIITVQIRDFAGIPDGLATTVRPTSLSAEHNYNLINQGWTQGNVWTAFSTDNHSGNLVGTYSFQVSSGLSITGGDTLNVFCNDPFAANFGVNGSIVVGSGVVSSYSGTTLTITSTFSFGGVFSTQNYTGWTITQTNLGHITAWHTAIGNFPSNADVWWYFKDSTGVFNPTAEVSNVTVSSSNAPQGHFLLSAFNQQRGLVSSIAGLTDVKTKTRPRTGCWFQGRVWYAGVDAQQTPTGDAPYYTWTENIYFSQIVTTTANFGQCYQDNDPTSDTLFDLLPTDGGVITIQGSGSIYKLFPIQNGLLVFAANGVWFITGSQGIGFSANDYTITRISAIQSISGSSFVDVTGLPYFWNEEGIYSVQPKQGGGLSVEPLTVGTILTFYNAIPVGSKKFARGAYHPIDYVIQWIYRDTNASNVTDRYQFNKILNFNTYNKSFFPYSIANGKPSINGINYVANPGGSSAPDPVFKYLTSTLGILGVTFSEENDDSFVDWKSDDGKGVDYNSFFITGYKVHGKGVMRFQVPYLYIFSRNIGYSNFQLQSIWDFGDVSPDSNKWSQPQFIELNQNNTSVSYRRVRLRGRGLAMQIKVSSTSGQPFDIMGWAMYETINSGV